MVAEVGDTVSVHYVGTKDDGEQFDSSRESGIPLTFVIGDGSMIPGFDQWVRGLHVGEKKTVRIEPAEAYGDKVIQQSLPLFAIQGVVGEDVTLTEWESYQPANNPPFTVISIGEEEITIEFENNHPLAGEALNFEIELVDLTKPTTAPTEDAE